MYVVFYLQFELDVVSLVGYKICVQCVQSSRGCAGFMFILWTIQVSAALISPASRTWIDQGSQSLCSITSIVESRLDLEVSSETLISESICRLIAKGLKSLLQDKN